MGGFISGITDAIGLTNVAGEKKAAKAAAKANQQALAMSKEQIALAKEELQFQKDQYKDFTDVYGTLQKNLGEYFNTLTPDKLVALGLENQQREFQQVDTALRREFVQKGLEGSGVESAVLAENQFRNASVRASIRTNADKMVTDQTLGFLGIGLGQGTEMLGIIGSSAANATQSYSNAVNSRTNIASQYLNQSTTLGQANIQSMSNVLGTAAGIAGYKYLRRV